MTDTILDIRDLVVSLGKKPDGPRIIDRISLQLANRETLCVVGESGSGKSVTSLTVMGLLQKGSLTPTGGSVKLVGEELLTATESRLRQLRATRMAMIFQEPMTALNPVVPVGRQIDEVLRAHTNLDARTRRKRILDMMEQVRLPQVERIFASYPHRLSGGQRQRIMIAMALVLEPKLLIADEPTTALDVTTQKQILTLIRDLQRDHGTAVLFITHDMGVVAEIADRVAVMRQGRLVETGSLDAILRTPSMDYTRNLLAAVPSLLPRAQRPETQEPVVLEANELGKVYRERSFFGRAREVKADVVADLRGDPQVVGDEEQRNAEPLLDLVEQFQNLCLDRDVERGDRFVGDEHRGVERERARNRDALTLAAGELMRIARHGIGWQPDEFEQLAGAA